MLKRILRFYSVLLLAFVLQQQVGLAQGSAGTMIKLNALRDDFINKIKAAGFSPSLPAPTIVLDNPPSFGRYDDSANMLHTGDWQTLPTERQAIFVAGAKRANNGATGESYFEMGVHEWIFIHELAHWWRACQHLTALPYESELAANRIAVAYWRDRDTALMSAFVRRYDNYLAVLPNPVPAGQSKQQYLNDNYDKLPGAAAYTWYQSGMIIDAYNEKPVLTFREVIREGGSSSPKAEK